MNEAFVYIWFVKSTSMYYIGYSCDDPNNYTHSSFVKEFLDFVPNSRSKLLQRKNFLENLPKGVRRRILARGKSKEMLELESSLHQNRYDRGKWDKYYNVNIGRSFPIDVNVSHGKLRGARRDPEIQRLYAAEKRKNPDFKAEENRKQKERKRQLRKEDPEKIRAYGRAYRAKNSQKMNAKARLRYAQKKQKIQAQARLRYVKKKLEKTSSLANLEDFFV